MPRTSWFFSAISVTVLLAGSACTCISPPQPAMYCSGTGTDDDTSRHIYRIENFATSPRAVDLGASGVRLTDIAIDPCGGEAYAISETVLYFVDLTTGAATAIGPLEGRLAQNSLEASCDGPLYIWGFHDTKIFSVDPATLRTELVADTRHYGADLAISPNGTDLYGSTLDNRLIRTNLKTGATTVLGTFGTAERLPGLDFTPDGRLFATSGNDGKDAAAVYRIDLTSGEATLVGPVKRIGRLGNGGMTIRW